jgi:hypothetical protein
MTNTKPHPPKRKNANVAPDIIFEHARVDPTHCLANGLFRPIQRGMRAETPLDISHPYKTYTFRWQHETERLCIKDQSVFLAALYLASVPGSAIAVGADHPDEKMQEARNALGLMLGAANSACLIIATTARELTNTLGLAINGTALTRIKDSLQRLAGVSFSITPEGTDNPVWESKLLSVVDIDGKNLLIGISPTLSKALNDKQSPVTYIDMKEQRALPTDAAKRLHIWLSAWLRPTEGKTIRLDLLVKHVWGDTGTGDTLYSRRDTIKKALSDLDDKTVWQCKYDKASESVYIKRTKLGQQAVEKHSKPAC